jgi:hypothetical protein
LITGKTAPRANAAHSPTSLAKPRTDRRPKGSGKPPSPLASPQPAPSPHARDLCSNQQGHVTALKHRTLPEPAVTPPSDDMAPCVRTPATVHGPQDLTGLRSDAPNPWGTLRRRRHYSRPPCDLSALRLGRNNPWGSIGHRHCRFYPPQDHLFSPAVQLQPPPDSHPYSHSQSRSPAQLQSPTHIFQFIQHPHGISPTKPKITKTIPTTPVKFQKNTQTGRCACGNIIPAYSPD